MHISVTPIHDQTEYWRQRPRYYACKHCGDDHGPIYRCSEEYEYEMTTYELEQTA